jgi:hypothetical protein
MTKKVRAIWEGKSATVQCCIGHERTVRRVKNEGPSTDEMTGTYRHGLLDPGRQRWTSAGDSIKVRVGYGRARVRVKVQCITDGYGG